jgi:hypothetical protein
MERWFLPTPDPKRTKATETRYCVALLSPLAMLQVWITGQSKRSTSSTALAISVGSSRSFCICRGLSSSAFTRMVKKLFHICKSIVYRYLIHDRDIKYCQSFRDIIESGDVKTLRLPARSPNLNAFSERWVKSVKEECLSKLILFGESSLRHTLREYLAHYNAERNHQGKGNILLFPNPVTRSDQCRDPTVHSGERLGGVLRYYYREAA